MSYCRWSSDNWMCDLYCYEDVAGGWTTHVAGRRRVGHIPPLPMREFLLKKADLSNAQFARLYREHLDAVKATELVDIELPHAGETFSDGTLEEFKARLLSLHKLGYSFPDYVIETIDEEIKERDANRSLSSACQ